MCGRYCSNRAAAVFNKHLKWLHMAFPVVFFLFLCVCVCVCGSSAERYRAWRNPSFTHDCRGDEKIVMCVVLNLTHLHFKSRLKNCWDGGMWGTTILPLSQWAWWCSLQGCGLLPRYCPQLNERETKRECTSLLPATFLLNVLSRTTICTCP